MSKKWMIYGAYGYTGDLMVRAAVRRGKRSRLDKSSSAVSSVCGK
jgi:short subunit dehydrogenase-like uncharacterized protein